MAENEDDGGREEEEAEEDEKKRRNEGGGQKKGDGNRNSQKGGGRRYFADMDKETELSSHPDFKWRLAKTSLSLLANALGRRANIGPIKGLLDKAESLFGKTALSFGTALAAAAVQEPQFVKRAVSAWGLPREMNGLADEFIDDVFEGVNMARFTGGKLTAKDADALLNEKVRVLEGKAKKIQIAQPTYDEIVERLDEEELVQLTAILKGIQKLEESERKKFDLLKPKIVSIKILRMALTLDEPKAFIEFLELHFGKTKTEGAVQSVIQTVKTGFASAEKAFVKVCGTADENERIAAEIREETQRRRTARQQRRNS